MDEFERDLENYLVELDGSSFPLDQDIFLEDAESCCSTVGFKTFFLYLLSFSRL